MTIAQQIASQMQEPVSYDQFNKITDEFLHKTTVLPTLQYIKYWLKFTDGSLLKLVDLNGLLKVEE